MDQLFCLQRFSSPFLFRRLNQQPTYGIKGMTIVYFNNGEHRTESKEASGGKSTTKGTKSVGTK